MDNFLTALAIGLLIGIPFGLYVSIVSNRHEPVRGGTPAKIFHALGCMALCSALPGVLAQVFLHNGFLRAIAVGFGSFMVGFLILCLYAIVERPALANAQSVEDRGWTAEKAKSSGL